jgi:hypothetical protein
MDKAAERYKEKLKQNRLMESIESSFSKLTTNNIKQTLTNLNKNYG